jgi:hypothetical protein
MGGPVVGVRANTTVIVPSNRGPLARKNQKCCSGLFSGEPVQQCSPLIGSELLAAALASTPLSHPLSLLPRAP